MHENKNVSVLETFVLTYDHEQVLTENANLRKEIALLNLELQKRDKCSFMGPMRDCPTHGEGKDAARYRWVLDRMRVTPSGFLELLNNIVPNNACEMLLGERVSVAIDLAIESTRPAGQPVLCVDTKTS